MLLDSICSNQFFNHHLLCIGVKQEHAVLWKISPCDDLDDFLGSDGAHCSGGRVELKLVSETLVEAVDLILQSLRVGEGLKVLGEPILVRNEVQDLLMSAFRVAVLLGKFLQDMRH